MTIDGARKSIIVTSLVATGLVFVFFLVAPPLGFPLEWDQGQRVIEILLPVFLGYLGTATHFLFHSNKPQVLPTLELQNSLLGLLIKGPIWVFAIACAAILFAFGYSNRSTAPSGSGMSIDQLSWAFTAALGILAVTSSVAVAYLFSLGEKPEPRAGEAAIGERK
jgi:hypothetical protein